MPPAWSPKASNAGIQHLWSPELKTEPRNPPGERGTKLDRWLWHRLQQPAQRSHCRKKGQGVPEPNSEPPQLLPQMPGEKKQNKYPSETGLFPTTCYNTRTKCRFCSKPVMSSKREEGNTSPNLTSSAQQVSLTCAGPQDTRECGREGTDPVGRVQPVGTCFEHHRQIPLQLLWGPTDT